MKRTIGLTLLAAFTASCTYAQYLASDFFEDIDPAYICSVEPITQAEKDSIIASGYAISEDPVSPFSPISIDPDRLRLRDVDIHVYTNTDGGWLVSVTSIMGNHGENQFTTFFSIDRAGRITCEMQPEYLGIGPVLANEFLDEPDYFPEEQNLPVPMYILDDGSFDGSMDMDEPHMGAPGDSERDPVRMDRQEIRQGRVQDGSRDPVKPSGVMKLTLNGKAGKPELARDLIRALNDHRIFIEDDRQTYSSLYSTFARFLLEQGFHTGHPSA